MTFWLILLLLLGSAILCLYCLIKILPTKTTNLPKQTLTTRYTDKAVIYIWLSKNRNNSQESIFGHVSLELLKYEYDRSARQHKYVSGSYKNNTYISFGPADYPPPLENILERLRPKIVDNYRDDLIYEEGSPDLTFFFHSLDVSRMISKIKSIKELKAEYGLLGSITFGYQTDSRLKRLTSWIRRLVILVVIFANKWLLFIPIVNTFCFRVLPSSEAKSYSCVSSVFDIFREGMGVSKLLGFSDELLTSIYSSKEASKESLESSKEEELNRCLSKVFGSFGYLTEASISKIIISPDIFADYMKQAKLNEIKLYEIPSERKRFKEENVKIKEVMHNFETEEWLPSSDIDPKKVGYSFLLFLSLVIFSILFAMILNK